MLTEPVKPAVEKIARECENAGATKWQALRIIKELDADDSSSEQKLKDKALALLQSLNPEAAKVFESFAKMHVHNSKQLVAPFDRGNIVKSLLQETHANRGIAEKIGAEVEDKIKDLKIGHLTTALVREMANAKLLEYGFEELRNKYARLGMPVADIEKEINASLFENKQILTEYALLIAIPKELGEHHFLADLQVCAIEDFCTKPFGFSVNPKPEAQTPEAFIPELISQLNEKKRFFSLPLNINALNFSLARMSSESSEQKTKRSAQYFFECLNALFCAEKEKPTITLNLFAPEGMEKAVDLKQKAILIANSLIEANRQKCLRLVVAVDSKFCLKALSQRALESELVFLNCSKEELGSLNEEIAFAKCHGLLGRIGLNLEKLALKNAGKESSFEQKLLEKTTVAKKIMELKKSELQKRHYLKENAIALEELRPALGVFKPVESAMAFLEKKEFDKEAAAFSEKTIKKISAALGEEWVITDFHDAVGEKRFRDFNEKELKQHPAGALEKSICLQTRGISRRVVATGRKELEEAIDAGIQLIKFSPSEQNPGH